MKTVQEMRMLEEAKAVLPTQIVFKRGVMRIFPSGVVAEYHSAELNQTVIFPNTFKKDQK